MLSMQKRAWREAAWPFALSRLLAVILTYLGTTRFPLPGEWKWHGCSISVHDCLFSWMRYDVLAYVGIAMHGYSITRDTAFFPLWPLLIHGVGMLFGGSLLAYFLTSMALSNLFFFLALIVFYKLLKQEFEASIARNALWYLTFAPFAIFFVAAYTESLFLLLCLLCFYFWHRGDKYDWWLAGLCGMLASLTRSAGIFLALPYFIVYIRRYILPLPLKLEYWREKVGALLPIALIPLGLSCYMLYLWYTKGDPLLFSKQEATWGRDFAFPWQPIWFGIQQVFDPTLRARFNPMDLAFVLLPLLTLALGWRRLPLHYMLFALVMAFFPLCYPQFNTLASFPRYLAVIFPVTMIHAVWSKHPRFDKAYLALMLPLWALNVMLFVNHYWVA